MGFQLFDEQNKIIHSPTHNMLAILIKKLFAQLEVGRASHVGEAGYIQQERINDGRVCSQELMQQTWHILRSSNERLSSRNRSDPNKNRNRSSSFHFINIEELAKLVNECMIDIFVLSGEAIVFMGMKSLSLKLEIENDVGSLI
ncbi:hypothetical protein SDJN02_12407, partial [Cucurbita argyrosperma subsp. argyrosperma]